MASGTVAVGTVVRKEKRMQRLARTQKGAATGGLALCDPTRGRALSEDIPQVRTPWSKTEAVTRGEWKDVYNG